MTNPDIWQVLLPLPFKDGFDYRVPPEMAPRAGQFVRVPFGRSEKVGILWQPGGSSGVDPAKIKSVSGALDLPPLPDDMIKMIDWVAAYTMNPRGAVLKMAMAEKSVFAVPKRARKPVAAEPAAPFQPPQTKLEAAQAAGAVQLRDRVRAGKFSAILLEGVTGSGKTEVYFEAIAECLAMGRQALVMLPEISLSDQLLRRFADSFGAPPILWHSDLRATERRRNWLAVARGESRVVVGAR